MLLEHGAPIGAAIPMIAGYRASGRDHARKPAIPLLNQGVSAPYKYPSSLLRMPTEFLKS